MLEYYILNIGFFILFSGIGILLAGVDDNIDSFTKIFSILNYKEMYLSVHNFGMRLPFTLLTVLIWFSITIPVNIFFAVNSIPFRILGKLIFSDTVKSIIMKG